ncbi:MAG: amidinotransferase, partial [Flavobacteriales bacterium]|nr:amidinotransferase [Flavobacteriales bacterium]
EFDYTPVAFEAFQSVGENRELIYHTNVMMCVAEEFAVICLDTIDDQEEREFVIEALEETDHEIIEISEEQKHRFAGNMLYVCNAEGKAFLVMSTSAYSSLDESQIASIEKYCPIIHSSLDTIEACGGGSARCMMAEVFLPKA